MVPLAASYALCFAAYERRSFSQSSAQTAQVVAIATRIAFCWVVLSADVRARYASPVGISVFLLVSVCVGYRVFRTNGHCLLEVGDLESAA